MITQKIDKLSQAMVLFEGWNADGSAEDVEDRGTVSYRNHNPGNLRKSLFALGVRDGFAYFYNDATGLFAMQYDIMMKAMGKTSTSLTPDSPLGEFIQVYSSATGDGLENYISHVEDMTGFSRNMPIGDLLTK